MSIINRICATVVNMILYLYLWVYFYFLCNVCVLFFFFFFYKVVSLLGLCLSWQPVTWCIYVQLYCIILLFMLWRIKFSFSLMIIITTEFNVFVRTRVGHCDCDHTKCAGCGTKSEWLTRENDNERAVLMVALECDKVSQWVAYVLYINIHSKPPFVADCRPEWYLADFKRHSLVLDSKVVSCEGKKECRDAL